MPSRQTMALSRRALAESCRSGGYWSQELASTTQHRLLPRHSRCSKESLHQTRPSRILTGSQSRSLATTTSHADVRSRVFTLQRRAFASSASTKNDGTKPKVKDALCSTRNSTSITTTTAAPSSSDLFFTAQEADRLSNIASEEHKRVATSSSSTETSVKQALDAANALLIISRPSNALADAILHRTDPVQIASLHRAFIEITSWCIDLISSDKDKNDNDTSLDKDNAVLLDRSLTLARRAYDLQLPFHLPLYQRLLNTVALHQTDAVASTILDISCWVTVTLDAPVDAAFFSQALLTLVMRRQPLRLTDAAELLTGMLDRHEIALVEQATMTSLLSMLRTLVQESLEDDPTAATSSSSLQLAAVSEIVSLLQASMLHLAESQEESVQLRQDRMSSILSSLEEAEMGALLDRLAQAEEEMGDEESEEEDFSTDDDSDEDDSGEGKKSPRDPLDLAIDAILTKNLTSDKAKDMLPGLLKDSATFGRNDNDQRHPKVREINFQSGGETIHATLEIDTDVSDLSDDDEDESDDILYSRTPLDLYQFPDVTAQVAQLIGGRPLRFTRAFEDIIWSRDYEDDSALFDRIFRNAHSSGQPDDDSSSGDDTDDDER